METGPRMTVIKEGDVLEEKVDDNGDRTEERSTMVPFDVSDLMFLENTLGMNTRRAIPYDQRRTFDILVLSKCKRSLSNENLPGDPTGQSGFW
ncbi:hypothetical protein Tco_0089166 [Tanacetum coccineum]